MKPQFAISSGAPETTDAGVRVVKLGGNAVDVAVASAITATVSEILMTSLGGSAFVMIHRPGRDAELIDGADMMPAVKGRPASNEQAFRCEHLPYGDGIEVYAGHASVAVPGLLAALELAWKRHGQLAWREIVAPALELARRPRKVDRILAAWLEKAGRQLFYPQQASRKSFFVDDQPLTAGDTYRIPDLDQALESISRDGAQSLYQGDLSILFAREMEENGGLVSRQDLASYKSIVRQPIVLNSGGFQLALNPAPAVGGAAVGALISLLESGWKRASTPADRSLLQARSQARVLELRKDPESLARLEDPNLRKLIGQVQSAAHRLQSPNTTHLSVASSDGWLVSITMSNGYGSGITIPGTGIPCNNSLGEPELNPRGFHTADPGSRLISNMAPTVAWHNDGRCLALGSPGASRITTSIAQVWARYAFEKATFEEAVEAPRLHVERMNDQLRVQFEPGIDPRFLPESEFTLRPFQQREMYFGAVKLAGINETGELHAVADDRRHGGVTITS